MRAAVVLDAGGESPSADELASVGPTPERLPGGPGASVDQVDQVNAGLLFTHLYDMWAPALK